MGERVGMVLEGVGRGRGGGEGWGLELRAKMFMKKRLRRGLESKGSWGKGRIEKSGRMDEVNEHKDRKLDGNHSKLM